ncbi:Leukotoxin translocation ATP-binding protein LktB [Candidatus Nitrospira nitrosa]|uniref:Leukotoxin translocation ATP-binding protein LktB n=1 Tax=Candidatus Nitrospira nitrosa TaxID=1742972 RepID=A0A0S4LTI0_9BACT|nr:type I secretion system permease/ATPase [Candidatus Nitrospira nitrosa]CUS38370.1 Leukotoxin translocation ATP-binding protein LktB [Candidatus Nitrospira nitrosa]
MSAASETTSSQQSDPILSSLESDESDTGLRCLLIIARYYDLPVNGAQLRHQFAQPGQKLSDSELLRTAKNLGLNAGLVTSEWHKLQGASLPAMAKLLDGGYVVVSKIEGEQVLVQNPVEGYSLVLSRDRFELIWTGELVLVTKRVTIRLHDLKFDLTWVIPGIVKYRKLFGEILIASAFLQFAALLTPFLTQLVIDTILVHQELSTLSLMAGGLIALTIFEGILGGLRTYLFAHTTNRMTVTLGARLFRHILSLPATYFDAKRAGDTVALVHEWEQLRQFVGSHSMTMLLDVPFAVVFLACMWLLSPPLTLVVMVTLPIYALLYSSMAPSIRACLRDLFNRETDNQAFVVEAVSGIQTVKAMAGEPSLWRKWDAQLAGYVQASVRATSLITIARYIATGVYHVTMAVVFWLGASRVIEGQLSIGQLIAFVLLSAHVMGLLLRWVTLWQEFQQVGISVQRLGDVLNRPPEPSYHPNRITIPQVQGRVCFEMVTFRYRPDEPSVIRKLSCSVEPGQIVGIVGRSGSGKSTIAKLLQCLYRPEQGRILVDGVDLVQVDPAWLRRHVGVVLHENVLFNGSVRDNIEMSNPAMPREQIIQAATLSGAHQFIVELENGYDTQIGERGCLLSSGQRQQIAIARALAANPRLLIFDEALSALDEESETVFQQNMGQIAQGRTVFIMTTRLSSLRQAHRLFVLDKGGIIEQGTYEELREQEGTSSRPLVSHVGNQS